MLFWEDMIALLVWLKYYYFYVNIELLFFIIMDLNILATIEKITLINMFGSIPHQKFCFIIYLLEDEQELSSGMLICLQRIYNFWLFHAIIVSTFDVLYSFTSYIISYFGTNLIT